MSYVDQDIHLSVDVSPAAIRAAIVDRGKKLAAEYAPDGQYHEPPTGVELDIIAEAKGTYGPEYEIDVRGLVTQINEETAGMQSEFWLERWNPGGIGAVDDNPRLALTFPSPRAGIHAHAAKLRNYRFGAGPWTSGDPRRDAVRSEGYMGIARTWRDLQGRWATSKTYAQSLDAIWTRLAQIISDMEGQVVPPIDISGFVPPRIVQQWFKPNGISYLGEAMEMRGVCVHQTGNTSATAEAQQNVNYMNSDECIQREASWHATVGLDVIIETIADNHQAYHASDSSGPGNTHFKAIEGVMCYPVGSPEFKRVMMNHAWYAAKSLRDNGLTLVANLGANGTLAQHFDFARDHKDCPQLYRDKGLWSQFVAYTQAFYGSMGRETSPVDRLTMPPLRPEPFGGKIWPYCFIDCYEQGGGIERFGLVKTGVFLEDGKLVAYSEAYRFEYNPAVPGQVERGLLGNEVLSARYPQGAPA